MPSRHDEKTDTLLKGPFESQGGEMHQNYVKDMNMNTKCIEASSSNRRFKYEDRSKIEDIVVLGGRSVSVEHLFGLSGPFGHNQCETCQL
jgi:hypothetical protein